MTNNAPNEPNSSTGGCAIIPPRALKALPCLE